MGEGLDRRRLTRRTSSYSGNHPARNLYGGHTVQHYPKTAKTLAYFLGSAGLAILGTTKKFTSHITHLKLYSKGQTFGLGQ